MRDGCAGIVVEHTAGGHVVDALGALAWHTLIAADLVGVDVSYRGVSLVVGRLADVLPIGSIGYGGEDVWGVLVTQKE